ncbi:hypothetical protein Hanom_Chr10g00924871 [Helianthus anomalus]
MKHKPYKATSAQFKDWSTDALREEIERITKMLNGYLVKPTPLDWKKGKQVNPCKALELKRMKAELVAANYGSARSIARWSESNTVENYKKLEQLIAKDPKVPQKPVYPTIAAIPQLTHTPKKLLLASALSANALRQIKRQKQNDEKDEQKYEEIRKEGIKCKLDFHIDPAADQLAAQLKETHANYGLDACDLLDLLNPDLERDIDDMISLDFEL